MFPTAYNILGATEEVKRDFVLTFSSQTTDIDKKLGKIFATNDVEFGTAFITLIHLALSHVQDNSITIFRQLDEIINPLVPSVTTNISFPSPSSPFSRTPNLEHIVNIPNLEQVHTPQQQFPQQDNPRKNWNTPTTPTPKRVNKKDFSRQNKKINKAELTTNDSQLTTNDSQPIITESYDLMEVDSIDMTHHVI